MQHIDTIEALRRALQGKESIGFVPTMGALHAGHVSLVDRARAENDVVVVSIFVNPTQFAPDEDFDRYPKTLEADLSLLEEAGVDFVFTPSVDEMYPLFKSEGTFSETRVVPGKLAQNFEGAARPTHFEGVTLVVSKLFNIVRPRRAYFGEKDYQQLLIIEQMVRDLSMPVEIVACPIIREESGLALSSRNRYFSETQKERATLLYRALSVAKRAYAKGERDALSLAELSTEAIVRFAERDEVDSYEILYLAVVDAKTLEPLRTLGEDPHSARMLISLNYESTHLIDNADLS